jgi:FkbM family methyltransferase
MLEAPEKILFQIAKPFLPENPVVFDVGAHKGSYTEFVLSELPGADCFLFEPNSELHKDLDKKYNAFNILLGELRGVKTFYQCADKADELSSTYRRDVFSEVEYNTEIKKCYTVDDFCESINVDHIDLLKIDVEGAELDVLNGAEKMLSDKKISFLQVEYGGTYPDAGITGLQVIQYLNGLGYKVYELAGDELKLIIPERFVEDYRYTNFLVSHKVLTCKIKN